MSKIEELINQLCPCGVKFVKLGNHIKVLRGRRLTTRDVIEDGEYPVYHGGIIPIGMYDKSNRKANTTMIINVGASAGSIAYSDVDFWSSDGCFCLEQTDMYDNRFLYHLIMTFESQLKSKVRKAGIPTLDNKIIENLILPVPPIEVQREIAHILDDILLLSIELSAELKARQKQYEYYRNELINNCKAKKGKLIELLSQPITDGPHTTPELFPSGVPFVSATAVYDGKVHLEDAKGFISKEFDMECSKKYKPKRNDVYMVKSGSTTGKVAYVDFDDDFNIWSPLAAMRTNNVITSRYIYHLLQTTDVQNQVQLRMSHGSQPNLSMRALEQFDVKIPDLDEQERIVKILDKLDFICNDIKSGIPAEIEKRQQQYEYYRDKLLDFKEVEVNE